MRIFQDTPEEWKHMFVRTAIYSSYSKPKKEGNIADMLCIIHLIWHWYGHCRALDKADEAENN